MEKLAIVKVGGKLIDSSQGQKKLVDQLKKIKGKKLVVHGGGILITQLSNKLGITTKMLNGRRITSKQNMDVVLMACAGKLNKALVAQLNQGGFQALGLTGADLNLITAKKRNPNPIDFGFVGDIEKVDGTWLKIFINQGIVPVIASVTQSYNFELLNTNADSIAGSLAVALSAFFQVSLFYMMDKPGVLSDVNTNDSVINQLSYQNYIRMKQDKTIHAGMLPKLDQAFLALGQGVSTVKIGNKINEGTCLSLN